MVVGKGREGQGQEDGERASSAWTKPGMWMGPERGRRAGGESKGSSQKKGKWFRVVIGATGCVAVYSDIAWPRAAPLGHAGGSLGPLARGSSYPIAGRSHGFAPAESWLPHSPLGRTSLWGNPRVNSHSSSWALRNGASGGTPPAPLSPAPSSRRNGPSCASPTARPRAFSTSHSTRRLQLSLSNARSDASGLYSPGVALRPHLAGHGRGARSWAAEPRCWPLLGMPPTSHVDATSNSSRHGMGSWQGLVFSVRPLAGGCLNRGAAVRDASSTRGEEGSKGSRIYSATALWQCSSW